MRHFEWVLYCGFVAACFISPLARAQDDPFGPVREKPIANPSVETDSTLAELKSALAGGLEPVAAESAGDFCKCVGETNSPSVAKIEQALASQIKSAGLDFTDAPLEEVIGIIQESYEIPVQLDLPALEEIGIGAEEPVTVNLHNISLRSALRLLLKPLQLTYVIRDEVLMITTPEEAESQLIICVYDVRELIDGPKDVSGVDALIDTIVQCVNTETWAKNGGGEAEIRPARHGLLVVSQTQAVHEEIRGLLETIRDVQKQSPAAVDDAQKSAAARTDPNEIVTRPYFLSVNADDSQEVRMQIKQLI